MGILLWTLIIACFLLSFVGLIYPIIPSVLLIWAGVFIYHFGINGNELSWISFSILGLLTVLIFVADILVNLHFVDKAGGSKWGRRAATIGLIIGSFVIPPFGVIVVPLILVLITEMLQQKPIQESIKIAFSTLIAFLSSTFAKAIIQLIMIIVFVLDVFF